MFNVKITGDSISPASIKILLSQPESLLRASMKADQKAGAAVRELEDVREQGRMPAEACENNSSAQAPPRMSVSDRHSPLSPGNTPRLGSRTSIFPRPTGVEARSCRQQ